MKNFWGFMIVTANELKRRGISNLEKFENVLILKVEEKEN